MAMDENENRNRNKIHIFFSWQFSLCGATGLPWKQSKTNNNKHKLATTSQYWASFRKKSHTNNVFFLYTLVWFFSIHINLPSYRSKVILFSFCYSFHHWHTRYTIINLLLISYLSSIYIHNTNFNPPYYPYLLLLLPWTKKRKKCDAYIRLTTPTRASKATIVY